VTFAIVRCSSDVIGAPESRRAEGPAAVVPASLRSMQEPAG